MPALKYSGDIKAVGGALLGDTAVIGTDPGGAAKLRVGGVSALNGNVAVGAAAVVNATGWTRVVQVAGAGSAAFSLLDTSGTVQQWDLVITSKNFEIFDVQGANHAMIITKATGAVAFAGQVTSPTLKASATMGVGTDPAAFIGLNVGNTALTGTVQVGAQVRPTFSSATTVTGRAIDVQVKTAAASFTVPTVAGLFVNPPVIGAGSTATEVNGIYVDAQTGGTTNYAIQTAGGRIRFVGLPTSASGLAAGTLWNNSGVLNVA